MDKSNKRLTKRQKEFIDIYKRNMCLVTPSLKSANVPHSTYYSWLELDHFNKAIEETKTSVKDFGESALFQLIREKNPAAVIFFNKCRNKDRGYVEKQEIEHIGQDFTINVNIPKEVKELLSN